MPIRLCLIHSLGLSTPNLGGFFYMAKDFAFMFMPGDYLRDTQCLSAESQVAYDRIMCEHMRNICITYAQFNFFTKRCNEDQKNELLMVLHKVDGGYQIEWVAESIIKRSNYIDSRRKNRESKKENICKSYDEHMENENEYINKDNNKEDKSENPVFGKSIVIKNAHDLFNEMMNAFTRRDQILKSTFAEKMKYTEYMLNKDIKEFIEEQRIADAFPKTLNEYFRHFFAWAKKKHKYNA